MPPGEDRTPGPVAALLRVPLLYKILVANALIVVVGAVVGTALTARLARAGLGTFDLVVLMASAGVLVSVLVNAVILRVALSPLREVERTARAVEGGRWEARARRSEVADRDLARLIRVMNQMLDRMERQRGTLRKVARRALGAAERERERVARDLQEDIAQQLATLLIRLRVAAGLEDPAERAAALEALREDLADAVDRVRRYARDLRPPALEDLGLVPALEGLARRAREEGVDVRLEADRAGERLAAGDELALYRMAQEALLNALRHASASEIVMRVRHPPDGGVVAEVEDDGVGFDAAAKLESGDALGLAGLRERAGYVGGSVEVESEPEKGTTVRILLPPARNRSPFASGIARTTPAALHRDPEELDHLRNGGDMRRVVQGLAGLLVGFLAGLAVALGVLVARARLQDTYVNALSEVPLGVWLPLFLASATGFWIGVSRRRRLKPWAVGCLGGILAGAGLGALPGVVVAADPAWPWAGGTMGAGLGGFVGAVIAWFRSGTGSRGRAAAAALGAILLLGGAASCDELDGPLPRDVASEPPPDSVESVVFLLGDPGQARSATHPVLPRLRRDIERWSAQLGPGGGRVVLLVLGDIIYPDGLSAPDAPGFSRDSARLDDQVALVAGPAARQAEARAFFLAGNHDWGQRGDWEGAVRLHRLAELLERRRAGGLHVHLEPPAGTGGPSVVDVGEHLRLVLLDTAWWLLEGERAARQAVIARVEDALAEAGGRRVVMAAHHPFHSAGPHGELLTLGSSLGIRTLLARSGALLQDLNSRPYRELRDALVEVGARHGAPDVFAGGHEHSLQVLEPRRPGEPELSVVVGSGSKLTDVGPARGMLAGASAPGYGAIFVLRDGTLRIQIEATPRAYLSCPEDERSCMERGLEGFRTIWDGSL